MISKLDSPPRYGIKRAVIERYDQQMPKVTVIVVTWNQREFLEECLESLRAQTFQDFELIVVDNGSSDGTAAFLSTLAHQQLHVISNAANLGFCAANNQGIAAARAEFVALLNDDAAARPGWLGAMLEAINADPQLGMVASKIVTYRNPQVIDKVGHLIYLDGQNRGRGTGLIDHGQFDSMNETAWPDGCAALYRATMLDQIGGFDEDFFAYADDAELGLRARIAGWTAVFAPNAVVRHRVGSSLGQYSQERLFLIERNRIWLAVKLFPLPLLLLNPMFVAARGIAYAVSALLGRGDLHSASKDLSTSALLKCFVRAQLRGLLGVPRMLSKRKKIKDLRKLSSLETMRLLWRYRITLRELVSQTR